MNCTKNGKCSNCGQCCIPWLPITWEEYLIIKDYIKEKNILPTPCKDGNNIYMDCPFHNRKEKKCNIYEVRPAVCRAFNCANTKFNSSYDDKAFFNGTNPGRFLPLDLLFYGRPDITVYFIHDFLRKQNKLTEEHYRNMLKMLSSGFPKEVPFPTTRDLEEAIRFEWE